MSAVVPEGGSKTPTVKDIVTGWSSSAQIMFQRQACREFVTELIGTFLLVCVGNAGAAAYVLRNEPFVDVHAICFCWGVGAMLAVAVAGPVSGCHINPAVTVAFWLMGKMSGWRKVLRYLAAQYIGALLAALVVYVNYHEGINNLDSGDRSAFGLPHSTGGLLTTYPAAHVSLWGAFVDQVIGTAFLVFGILAVTVKAIPFHQQPLYVLFVVTGVCISFGLNTAAVLNPARDLAPRLLSVALGYGWQAFSPLGGHYWWAAGVAGPHCGGIVATWLWVWLVEKPAAGDQQQRVGTPVIVERQMNEISEKMNETAVTVVPVEFRVLSGADAASRAP